jgi:hypothetical protein
MHLTAVKFVGASTWACAMLAGAAIEYQKTMDPSSGSLDVKTRREPDVVLSMVTLSRRKLMTWIPNLLGSADPTESYTRLDGAWIEFSCRLDRAS